MRGAGRYREFRIRQLSHGNLSPYLGLSFLIHLGLGILLLQSLLHVDIPQPKEVPTIRLVSLNRPTPETKKAIPKKAARRDFSTKVSPPSPPKVTGGQPDPTDISRPLDPPQPQALRMGKSLALPSTSPSSHFPDDLLSPTAEKSRADKPLSTPPALSKEGLYRPAQPSALGNNLSPKKIGAPPTTSLAESDRSRPTGPLSGIDRLPAGAAGIRQTVGIGPTSTRQQGFQVPSGSMAIGSPPPSQIAGLKPSGGDDRYIPLDSDDPDLGPYLRYLTERIKKFWRTPEGAEALKGQLDMTFTVERDGRVSKVQVVSSSGYGILDQGIMAAVERAAPFRPIPEEIREKRLPLIGSFSYNQPLPQKVLQ